jgi:hypothetical protein
LQSETGDLRSKETRRHLPTDIPGRSRAPLPPCYDQNSIRVLPKALPRTANMANVLSGAWLVIRYIGSYIRIVPSRIEIERLFVVTQCRV